MAIVPVLHDHPFTKENARAFQAKGVAARKAKLVNQSQPHEVADARAREVLELIRSQIRETDAVLRDRKSCYCEHCERGGIDGKTRAQLLGALDRLLERERVWSQRPGPANIKVQGQRQRYWERPAPTPSYQAQPVPEPAANGNLSGDSIPPVKPQ